mmetsp:Transcript_35415/g.89650  ORF Transcript_35415/g.89650 Transcript_35415/m.89650 type:complete len:497 (-) Transcript_35415:257-1747(-)
MFGLKLHDPFTSDQNAIKLMPWELQLMDMLSLHKDQLRFTIALVASVLVGMGFQLFRSPTLRHLYSYASGLALLYYVWGACVLHAFIPAALTYAAMLAAPRSCGALAWLINFPYLLYMHIASPNHYDAAAGALDFTGCMMVLVLKLISVAHCYQDFRVRKKEDMNDFQQAHALHALPGMLPFASFVFGGGNLLAGPYVEYTEYDDWVNHKGVFDPRAKKRAPSGVVPGITAFAKAFLYMGCYLYMMPRFNVGVLFSPWYQALPFAHKNLVQFIAGVTSQFKYCFAWTLAEASATFSGLNFWGWDDKSGKARWGRCSNIHFFLLLATDSARLVPLHWNIITGVFLRRYVYERLTPKGKRPGFPQLLATQMTSALWHGLSGGQALFFASTALSIQLSGVIYNIEQGYLPKALAASPPWFLLKLAWNQYNINYLVLAFHILDASKSLQAWGSTGYWAHWFMLAGCVLGALLPKRKPKSKDAKGKDAKPDAAAPAHTKAE